ncbi:MAG: YbaK/prolyl-tRNA synthetase associated domain-containing protein [Rhodospirillales bacterium]|nr:YbaK/prolyl-tRNA synthetase associated domain-containing protein [Rhodospirillales bacterium]
MSETLEGVPTTHERIVRLLEDGGARYRIVEHPAEGRTEEIAKIRGNHPSQSLKAIVVTLKGGGAGKRTVMAVVPGNRRLDMKTLCNEAGAQKGGFAPPEVATAITGCVMGAVPPFTFWEELPLIADPAIGDNREVCFNAGRLDRSIFMDINDYVRLARPQFAVIAEPPAEG